MTDPGSGDDVAAAIGRLRRELRATADSSLRIDGTPETIEQGLAKLVLTLVEFLRRLLERQAIRRMEGGSLTDDEVEAMGLALMKLEDKIGELAAAFGLTPNDLNLDLGPLGDLMKSGPVGPV